MNYGLAKELYGVPWCVDQLSFQSLNGVLKNIQNGVKLEIPEIKYNSFSLLEIKNNTRTINYNWQLNNKDDFEAIGVINLNGPIIKNSGNSTTGTKELSENMLLMSKDNRIKGFILKVDSGGGSSNAVELMSDTINEVKKTKPVYALIEKGGYSASAAYGISSAANFIYSEDGMSTVGSVGTMIQFSGKPHGNVDQNGEKEIVLYASKSTMKNKAFNEALDNDNYTPLINELLDPVNENFINLVQTNRPQLKGTKFDNGHTVFTKDAIGTFIDGIASFDEVVQMILNDSKKIGSTNNINSNSKTMTKEEFKNAHPAIYNEIVQEGVTSEANRVAAWMAHSATDMETVVNGINSGKEITNADTQALLVKQVAKSNIAALRADSPAAVIVNASEGLESLENEQDKELEQISKGIKLV